jgi:signal transduction histidine kinase
VAELLTSATTKRKPGRPPSSAKAQAAHSALSTKDEADTLAPLPWQEDFEAAPRQYDAALLAGRGSGKTFALVRYVIRDVEEFGAKAKMLFVRRDHTGGSDFITKCLLNFPLAFGPRGYRFNSQSGVFKFGNGATLEVNQIADVAEFSKFQGRDFSLLLIDEAQQWPSPEPIDLLRSNLRGPADVPPRMILTANAGGPGHSWLLKRYYRKAAPWEPFREASSQRDWIWIPSTFRDNDRIDQAEYQRQLVAACAHDPARLKGWLDNDWFAVLAGAFFADEVTRGLTFTIEPSRLPRAVAARIEHGALPREILILRGDWLREDDVAVVQLLGAQLSASLEMARLYAEARQRLDELAATQARLVQRERLAAIGELAAVMAHEVRNPLGVIFNALSGLARVVPAGGDARLFVDIVREESVRLNRIVGDLLDYARPIKPELAPVRLLDVIDDALDAAAAADTGRDKGAALSVVRDVPESLPDAKIDARLMRQAILNLALNAMQAMPTGGTLTVSARTTGKALTIAVSDTGAGMSPEVAARVFEPFFTTRSTGTGLGLAVVKRIAESHEGEVSVESRAGSGTTFTLTLPV